HRANGEVVVREPFILGAAELREVTVAAIVAGPGECGRGGDEREVVLAGRPASRDHERARIILGGRPGAGVVEYTRRDERGFREFRASRGKACVALNGSEVGGECGEDLVGVGAGDSR